MMKRAMFLSAVLAASAGCSKNNEATGAQPAEAPPIPAEPEQATEAEPETRPMAAAEPEPAERTLVAEGEPAPAFTATAQDGSEVSLSDLRGKPVVLYFYPKDFTGG